MCGRFGGTYKVLLHTEWFCLGEYGSDKEKTICCFRQFEPSRLRKDGSEGRTFTKQWQLWFKKQVFLGLY